MTTRRTRLLAPLLVALLGLLAASCGGSDDAAGEAVTVSSDAVGTAESATSTDQSDAYCRTKAEADALLDTVDVFDPDAVEAAVRQSIGLIEAAIEIAPAEIRDDLGTIRANADDYVAVLEENDWDLFAAAPELEALDARPEPEAAEDRIEVWEDANCDFPEDEADGDDAFGDDPFTTAEAFEAMLETDGGRALMIEGMTEDGDLTPDQAGCLLDNLDFDALSALADGDEPDPEVFGLLFEVAMRCGLEEMFGFGETEDAGTDDSAVDAELLEAMLATESGRSALLAGMTADGRLSADQAACLLDNLAMETLVVLMADGGGEPSREVVVAMLELIDTCDLGSLLTS